MLTFCHSCHAARRLSCRLNVPKNGPANRIFLDFRDSHFSNNLIINILGTVIKFRHYESIGRLSL